MRTIIRIFGIFLICAVFGYILIIGLNACGCIGGGQEVKQPDYNRAQHYLLFKATGRRIYVNDVSVAPSKVQGKEIYTPVGGYWEMKENKYVYIDRPVALDEAVFGDIELRRNDD